MKTNFDLNDIWSVPPDVLIKNDDAPGKIEVIRLLDDGNYQLFLIEGIIAEVLVKLKGGPTLREAITNVDRSLLKNQKKIAELKKLLLELEERHLIQRIIPEEKG